MNLGDYIRHFPDFPRKGIVFHDISPLLADAAAFAHMVDLLAEKVGPWRPDVLAGIEARGFFVAGALAQRLGLGMVMVRKKGKLPGPTLAREYTLEYGAAALELQKDAFAPGSRVAVLDDLLATGGTFKAAIALVRDLGAKVCGAACVMEMPDLGGRKVLDVECASLVDIEGD